MAVLCVLIGAVCGACSATPDCLSASEPVIELRQVGKSFGATRAVDDVSLAIERGEFVVLIGASGSGKSTLLKMINRLVEHDRGMILFQNEQIRSFKAEDIRRRMGYAIQSIGLFPHWSVARNIATVPELLGWSKARIEARVDELLALLGLEPALYRRRYPHQLSGGQQQRVGVARALAADPEVLLMDEPFGALDPITRGSLQQELARIHQASGKTIVLVTHDIEEALRLATRIVLLDQGRVVQDGPPAQLLGAPANDFVGDFFGRAELGLRLLALQRVAERLRPGEAAEGTPLADTMSLRDALSQFVVQRAERLPVADAAGRVLGAIRFGDLLGAPRSK
jgi:osmoprotectant transport system ATP-binding protein